MHTNGHGKALVGTIQLCLKSPDASVTFGTAELKGWYRWVFVQIARLETLQS